MCIFKVTLRGKSRQLINFAKREAHDKRMWSNVV